MATITKRTTSKGVTYRAAVRRAGFPSRSKSFSSKRAAEAWARKVEADLESLKAGTAPAESVTLAEATRDYLDGYRGKDESIAQRCGAWLPYLGSLALARIGPDHIRSARDKLATQGARRGDGRGRTKPVGRPLSGATLNRYLSALSAVLKHATRHHGLAENPVGRVGWLPEGKPRDRVLTDDELDRLLDAARASAWERLYLLVLMACTTGARKGELLKLRWSDIDWRGRAVTFYDTKNGDDRLVPLAAPVVDELQRFAQLGDAHVFPSTRRPGQPMEFRKPWEQALAAAGLDGVVFHSLRHSAVTRLANLDDNAMRVAKLVGHRDLRTTKRYYHPSAEDHRDLTDALAARLKGRKS